MRMSLMALLAALVFASAGFGQSKSIEGVWALTEITTTGPNGSTKQMTQPSLWVFTKKHYSMIFVSGQEARPEVTVDSATAEQLKSTFVDNFVANGGTYEIKGGKITTRPMVAKSPGFMKPGNFTTSSYKLDGNTHARFRSQ